MYPTPLFSVIIPVFNKWELTSACLHSLRDCTDDIPYEVIVLDNASSDDTACQLEPLGEGLFGQNFRRVRFEKNRNFGPACNAGAQLAKSPFLFFLNNDTLLTPSWAKPLVQAFIEDPDLGGVGPLLLYPNDTVQHVGVTFSMQHPLHIYRYFPVSHPAVQKKRTVQVLSGAALMVNKKTFMATGCFHEGYRNGFEDVDFCLQLRKQGKILKVIPASVIYHLESQTLGRSANEEHNGKILTERCSKLFYPDEHLHGLADGFYPFVREDMDIGLRMPIEQEEALMMQTEGKPVSYWRSLMLENPLWMLGREHLARIAESQQQWDIALLLRTEIASSRVSVSDHISLLAIAEKANDLSTITAAKTMLTELSRTRNDLLLAKKRLHQAISFNDKILIPLYEEKVMRLKTKSQHV